MLCPRCKTKNFETKDYEGVEIDICLDCQGVWLDHGELFKIIENKATEA